MSSGRRIPKGGRGRSAVDSYNYRAVNRETGERCPHKHHSRDHALQCADALGWTYCSCERFNSKDEGRYKQGVGRRKIREISMEEAAIWYC